MQTTLDNDEADSGQCLRTLNKCLREVGKGNKLTKDRKKLECSQTKKDHAELHLKDAQLKLEHCPNMNVFANAARKCPSEVRMSLGIYKYKRSEDR